MTNRYIPYFPIGFIFIGLLSNCKSNLSEYTVDALTLNQKILSTDSPIIIDVRTPAEYKNGYLYEAQNINFNSENFQKEIKKLDKNQVYFLYCLSGGRSHAAANYMRGIGFKHVYDLDRGLIAWEKQGLPITMKRPPKQLDKISFKEYQEMVRSGRKVLVDFYTTWSVPSKKMEPIIEQITLENKNSLIVIRINADENQSLINELGLETFPEFKIYKEGIEVWKHNGIIEKKVLEDKLKH